MNFDYQKTTTTNPLSKYHMPWMCLPRISKNIHFSHSGQLQLARSVGDLNFNKIFFTLLMVISLINRIIQWKIVGCISLAFSAFKVQLWNQEIIHMTFSWSERYLELRYWLPINVENYQEITMAQKKFSLKSCGNYENNSTTTTKEIWKITRRIY